MQIEKPGQTVPSNLQVNKEKPAASLPKITAEGFPEAESSLLGHEKTVGLRLLEPDGTSKEDKGQKLSHSETSPPSSGIKEVSSVAETQGKAQKAESPGGRNAGNGEERSTAGRGDQNKARAAGRPRKGMEKETAGKGRRC